jgi:multidrug resistance efflux pump
MRTGTKYLLSAAILGTIIFGMAGCNSKKNVQGKTKKPKRVKVIAAEKTRMVEILETTGDVIAANTVIMKATVEGPISFCPWREGDRIEKAGQKIIEIDRPLYRQEAVAAEAVLAVAKAKLDDLKAGARPEEIAQAKESVRHFDDCTDFAKANLGRVATLVKSGSLSAESVEKARVDHIKCQTQLKSAREKLAMMEAGPTKTEIAVLQAEVDEAAAKLALARAKLDECQLKAPFAGIITQVFVRPGDLATPRASLLKMMDPLSLVIRAGLPENCSANISEGTEVTVRLDAYPQKIFRAEIERVYPRLEWNSRTRMIEAKIIDPVDLLPRMFARLSVQGRTADDAVVVPDGAIVTTPRGDNVVFVIQQGKAIRRKVKIGLEQGKRIQIIDGVKAGEMVVIEGNLNLKNGASVQMGKKSSVEAKEKPSGGKTK